MIRAFVRSPGGVVGPTLVLILLLVAVAAPPLLGDQVPLNVSNANQHPSAQHVLGTDHLGRDLLLRILVSSRATISMAIGASALAAVLGYIWGIGASLLPHTARSIALRTVDAALAFPAILVAIFVAAITGPGALGAMLGVAIATSFSFARVSSSLALSIGGREFVHAARLLGVGVPRLMARHVLPNVAEALTIQATVAISSSIVHVSSLSFLGLGVQPPDADWGLLLTEGVRSFYATPIAALGPAVAIAISALSFGLSGEAFARSLNPVLWAGSVGVGERPSHLPQTVGAAAQTGASERASAPVLRSGRSRPDAGHAVEVRDIGVTFPGPAGPIRAVDGVSFSLGAGEIVGLVGESGSGKTTLALALADLIEHPGAVSGHVSIGDQPLSELSSEDLARLLGTDIGVVFQDPMSSLNPALTIGTQMTETSEVHRGLGHRDALAVATKKLREVNMPMPDVQTHRHPHELSGGMRQRVMIAMGLMGQLKVLIADEPTTALDVTIQAQIMQLLAQVNRDHKTAILLISHNLGLVAQNSHRVMVMYAGRIVEDARTESLLERPMHPYTAALLACVPDLRTPRDAPLPSVKGALPDLADLPEGCAYNPRCPLAIAKCRSQEPGLVRRPDGRRVACWVANQDLH